MQWFCLCTGLFFSAAGFLKWKWAYIYFTRNGRPGTIPEKGFYIVFSIAGVLMTLLGLLGVFGLIRF